MATRKKKKAFHDTIPDETNASLPLALVEPPKFVAARNAEIKVLQAKGRAAEAADLRKRKRPSWTTWALAHLAADHAELLDTVFASGASLQHAALSGGDVRSAQSTYSAALEAATRAALDALTKAGQHASAATQIRDVRSALRAAVLRGPSIRSSLRDGTFDPEAENAATPFGLSESVHEAAMRPKKTASQAKDDTKKARAVEAARKLAAEKQKRRIAELREALEAAGTAREDAEREVKARKRALADATKAEEAAAITLESANKALRDAQAAM